MGLIAATALILATQTAPEIADTMKTAHGHGGSVVKLKDTSQSGVSKARLDEIWDHIDNRVNTQSDLWFEDGEFPKCISLLRVQYAYTPDDYDIMTSLGWMLENVHEMDKAREVYLEFNNRHPEDGGAMFALGNSFYTKKDYDNTIKVLEPILTKAAPLDAYIIVAKSYERKGKLVDALRIWELELKKYPNAGTATINIKRVKAKIAAGGK